MDRGGVRVGACRHWANERARKQMIVNGCAAVGYGMHKSEGKNGTESCRDHRHVRVHAG